MKTVWMKFLYLFLLCPVLWGCDNENEELEEAGEEMFAYPVEVSAYVGFTNNAGENVTGKAPQVNLGNCVSYGYSEIQTWKGSFFGDGGRMLAFDSWTTYCDGEFVGSSEKDKTFGHAFITRNPDSPGFQMDGVVCMVVCGNSPASIMLRKKGTLLKGVHVLEHHIVSQAIFGDEETHVLRIEAEWHTKEFKVQIQMDGVNIQPYYHSQSDFEPIINKNFELNEWESIGNAFAFLINVDKL